MADDKIKTPPRFAEYSKADEDKAREVYAQLKNLMAYEGDETVRKILLAQIAWLGDFFDL